MEKAKAESLKFLSDAQISDTDYYVSDDDGFRPPVVRPTQKYVLVKSDVKGSALMWLGCLWTKHKALQIGDLIIVMLVVCDCSKQQLWKSVSAAATNEELCAGYGGWGFFWSASWEEEDRVASSTEKRACPRERTKPNQKKQKI